jgi:catechol 2,3-dioxygenase-like lactoylglutathione lyase family enzyme
MSAPRPLLNQLNLVVRDFDATVAFYRRLGLDIPERAIWRTASGAHHCEVEMPNGMHLEFDSPALAAVYNAGWRAPAAGGGRALIGFALPSRAAVDERYAELTGAGYTGRQPPYDAFWGSRYAVVADPDGNDVGLMSRSDPAHRSTPPTI